MSYVPAPDLSENGSIVVRRPDIRAIDAGGFDTFGQVKAFLSSDDNYLHLDHVSERGGRERQHMQKGIDDSGNYFPTAYYSWSANVNEIQPVAYAIIQDPPSGGNPGKFSVRYREAGLGYLGGYSTGLGSPWEVFRRRSSNGSAARILNMAVIDNLLARAEVECLNKARDQKFSVAESIVDIDKTIVMIAGKVRQVANAWKAVRRRDFKKALDWLLLVQNPGLSKRLKQGSFSSNWLALMYGWMPLLMDIYDGVNLVNEGISKPTSTFTVTRRIVGDLPTWEWMLNPTDDPWKDYKISPVVASSATVKLRFRVSDANLAYLTSLGLDNPLFMAWAALPLSFVIDWLLPVGDWLNAFTAPLGLTFVDGYRTIHTEGVLDIRCGLFGIDSFDSRIVERSDQVRLVYSFVEVERSVYTTPPTPHLYFRLPFTDKNPGRVLTSIALLTQLKGLK